MPIGAALISFSVSRPFFRGVVNRLDERIAVSLATRDYVSAYFPGAYKLIPTAWTWRSSAVAIYPFASVSDG